MSNYKIIDGEIYQKIDYYPEFTFCPKCNGSNLIEKEEDELFYKRQGCLDCDIWLFPYRLKRK